MLPLPPKHTAASTNIFTVMSALATEHGAINLSQGFPDFPVDIRLAEVVFEAIKEGHNQYAPMAGAPILREAVAGDFLSRYHLSIDPGTEITITPGATYAIYTAFATILQPGDEAIVLEPAYDCYIPAIEMAGAKPVTVPLTTPDFAPDWERIRAAINPKTKAIIINTPHNPTGAIWTNEDYHELQTLVEGTDIYIISDEVYEQIIFDGRQHLSILKYEPLRSRAYAIYSFGKSFHNTGWKTGYCIAPPELTAAFRRVHQFIAFTVNTPVQYGLAAYIGLDKPTPVALLQPKRDLFLDLIKDTAFTVHTPAAGSYFQLANYSAISDMGDMEFARWLTKEHSVATVPMSAFYRNGKDDHLIRFCFAKKEETLKAAVNRLRNL